MKDEDQLKMKKRIEYLKLEQQNMLQKVELVKKFLLDDNNPVRTYVKNDESLTGNGDL